MGSASYSGMSHEVHAAVVVSLRPLRSNSEVPRGTVAVTRWKCQRRRPASGAERRLVPRTLTSNIEHSQARGLS